MNTATVTYDPGDDKLRVYFAFRQGDEITGRLKAAGFRWAGAQECWHAHWTPEREDAALEAADVDEIDDETSTLADRAANRAERFSDYRGSAKEEAERLWKRDQALAEAMNGQPVLVGHHSEKRHRRDLQRMVDAMRGAAKAERRATYWERRASGSIRWADHKDRPDVRARRIKGLEADARRVARSLDGIGQTLKVFVPGAPFDRLKAFANDGRMPTFGASRAFYLSEQQDPITSAATVAAAIEATRAGCERESARLGRWRDHLAGRIEWERSQLAQQGGARLLEPKPRKPLLPVLNLRAGSEAMPSQQYQSIHRDYRAMRNVDGKYRVRTALVNGCLCTVFLTDKREDQAP